MGIAKTNVHNFLDTCPLLGNAWLMNIFGDQKHNITRDFILKYFEQYMTYSGLTLVSTI
jgi:hypothetical protein